MTSVDWSLASTKEVRFETVLRYAHQYPRAIQMLGSGKADLKPLIPATHAFEQAIEAFDRAAEDRLGDVKIQISMP